MPERAEARRALVGRCWKLLPAVVLLLGSLAFRLPALLNAGAINSDAAVAGLQALHFLRGEWSWFLWGASYQGTLDVLLMAGSFLLFGPTPLALMAVPLAGHLLLTYLAFDVVRRHAGAWGGVAATLPLVLATLPINLYLFYAQRQWCVTTLVAAVWLFDRASSALRPGRWLATGAFLGVAALYVDLFAALFLPGLVLLAALCCLDRRNGAPAPLRRLAGTALGACAGAVFVWLVRRDVPTPAPPIGSGLAQSGRLLWETCLPFLLGYRVFVPGLNLYPDLWVPGPLFAAVQRLGAVALAAGIVYGGVASLCRGSSGEVRRLGAFGATVSATSVAAFLLTGFAVDLWSARYLAPILWTAPFALVPAVLLRRHWLALGLLPYALSAGVAGWLGYGPFVRGPLPVREAHGVAAEASALEQFLLRRGVRFGAAQYWLAYRLTFLFGEDVVLVPLDPREDRHPPYRRGFDAAAVVAYVFHPSELRARPAEVESALARAGEPYERSEVAGFTVLIHRR